MLSWKYCWLWLMCGAKTIEKLKNWLIENPWDLFTYCHRADTRKSLPYRPRSTKFPQLSSTMLSPVPIPLALAAYRAAHSSLSDDYQIWNTWWETLVWQIASLEWRFSDSAIQTATDLASDVQMLFPFVSIRHAVEHLQIRKLNWKIIFFIQVN